MKENGKRINYTNYLKEMNNNDCNRAILRCFENIKIDKIYTFIDEIECISEVRKKFYKEIINIRYNVLQEVYNALKNH